MKQIALIVVTILKAFSGISLLNSAPTDTTIAEMTSALLGTLFLLSLAKAGDACLFLPRLKSMRLVENKPLLPAEAAEVSTTKLIIPAAIGMPANVNTWTNGLLAADISYHGLIHRMTNSAPT